MNRGDWITVGVAVALVAAVVALALIVTGCDFGSDPTPAPTYEHVMALGVIWPDGTIHHYDAGVEILLPSGTLPDWIERP